MIYSVTVSLEGHVDEDDILQHWSPEERADFKSGALSSIDAFEEEAGSFVTKNPDDWFVTSCQKVGY